MDTSPADAERPRRPKVPPSQGRRRSARLLIAFGIAAGLGGGWLVFSASRTSTASLDRLEQRCRLEMLRGTCRVQSGAGTAAPVESTVFVAGVGAIDAAAYRRLRDAGQTLCRTVRDDCTRDWTGVDCRAARALHGEP